jgi:hypothetical protein
MSEIRIHIDRLLLRDVPREYADGMDLLVEDRLRAYVADGGAPDPLDRADEQQVFADVVARQVWESVAPSLPRAPGERT